MQATINGKTIVTIKTETGKFVAVEVSDSDVCTSETEALRAGVNRILDAAKEADERKQAEAVLDEDEYFAGKTAEQKKDILRAAKTLGRTVYLGIEREGGESTYDDFQVRIVGTDKVGLKAVRSSKTAIISYDEITGGYVNDPE